MRIDIYCPICKLQKGEINTNRSDKDKSYTCTDCDVSFIVIDRNKKPNE